MKPNGRKKNCLFNHFPLTNSPVAQWLTRELSQQTLTLSRLQTRFCPSLSQINEPLIEQHSLSNYDQLLTYDSFSCPSNFNFTATFEIPAPVSYESTVGISEYFTVNVLKHLLNGGYLLNAVLRYSTLAVGVSPMSNFCKKF